MKGRSITDAEADEIRRLRLQGVSRAETSRRTGLSLSSVTRIVGGADHWGHLPNLHPEIQRRRDAEADRRRRQFEADRASYREAAIRVAEAAIDDVRCRPELRRTMRRWIDRLRGGDEGPRTRVEQNRDAQHASRSRRRLLAHADKTNDELLRAAVESLAERQMETP